mmetsp:Transcript_25903/g.29908  ORF Transcript_25903/g.29908 Transcript_25903/m.29908 type:complete len:110 (+) Transcript_25903:243-572(+)
MEIISKTKKSFAPSEPCLVVDMKYCHYMSLNGQEDHPIPLVGKVIKIVLYSFNEKIHKRMLEQLVKFQLSFKKYKPYLFYRLASPCQLKDKKLFLNLLKCVRNENEKGE